MGTEEEADDSDCDDVNAETKEVPVTCLTCVFHSTLLLHRRML